MTIKKKLNLNLPESGQDLITLLTEHYSITDGAALILVQQAAVALDSAIEAEKIIKKFGMVVQGERGLSANPACSVARDSRNRLLSALSKLHLEL